MTTGTITHSPGIPISTSGLVAGGGRAASGALGHLIDDAARRLSAHFQAAPVTVRFNTGGASGGAWLQTHVVDAIGRNTEVGITAWTDPDTGEIGMGVMLSPLVTGADRAFEQVSSVDEAITVIEAQVSHTYASLVEALAVAAATYREDHVRIGLSSVRSDGAYFVFARDDEAGTALLAKVARSRSKVNGHFGPYAPISTFEIASGRVRPRGGYGAVGANGTPWLSAHDVQLNTIYRVTAGGSMIEDLGQAVRTPRATA